MTAIALISGVLIAILAILLAECCHHLATDRASAERRLAVMEKELEIEHAIENNDAIGAWCATEELRALREQE